MLSQGGGIISAGDENMNWWPMLYMVDAQKFVLHTQYTGELCRVIKIESPLVAANAWS